jgi:hypothetical protein
MDYIKELEEIVKNDVLIEISQNSKKNKDLKEELKYMEQVKLYFDEVILDIENKTMTQEQALDILEGLEDMRADNQEV